jgi:hypothetical protein
VIDAKRDPLPIARDAINLRGTLPSADVVFLAQALIEAHAKIDQLYQAIEGNSDATRKIVEKVLRDTAMLAASTAAYRALRIKLREALDRGPVFEEHPDQLRLDWLGTNSTRLLDARLRMLDESISLRDAIDALMQPEESRPCS